MMNGILEIEDTRRDTADVHRTTVADKDRSVGGRAIIATSGAPLPCSPATDAIAVPNTFRGMKAINVPASPSDLAGYGALLQHRSRRRSSHSILGGQGSPSFSSLVDALSRASGEPRGSTAAALFGEELTLSRGLEAVVDVIVPPVVPPPPSPTSLDAALPLTDLRDPESMSATELDRLFGSSMLSTSWQEAKKTRLSSSPLISELAAKLSARVATEEQGMDVDEKAAVPVCPPGNACAGRGTGNASAEPKIAAAAPAETTVAKSRNGVRVDIKAPPATRIAVNGAGHATSLRGRSESVPSLETLQANAANMLNNMMASRTAAGSRRASSSAAHPPSGVSGSAIKSTLLGAMAAPSLRRPLIVPAPRRSTSAPAPAHEGVTPTGLRNAPSKTPTTTALNGPRILTTGMRLPAPLMRPRPNLSRDLMRNIPRAAAVSTGVSTTASPSTSATPPVTKDVPAPLAVRSNAASPKIAAARVASANTTHRESASGEQATAVASTKGGQGTTGNEASRSASLPVPSSSSSPSATESQSMTVTGLTSSSSSSLIMIPTMKSVSPAIFLTVLEATPVFTTILGPSQGFSRDFRMLRRVDTGYVNASALLEAGGIETEAERSVILSLEVSRVRVRQRDSELFGTWIPLSRARALAATCSLQNRLGPFLNDNLATYFPTSLLATPDATPKESPPTLPASPAAAGPSVPRQMTPDSDDAAKPGINANPDTAALPANGLTPSDDVTAAPAPEADVLPTMDESHVSNAAAVSIVAAAVAATSTHAATSLYAARAAARGPWIPMRSSSTDTPGWLPWARQSSQRHTFADATRPILKHHGKSPMLSGSDDVESVRNTFGGLSVALSGNGTATAAASTPGKLDTAASKPADLLRRASGLGPSPLSTSVSAQHVRRHANGAASAPVSPSGSDAAMELDALPMTAASKRSRVRRDELNALGATPAAPATAVASKRQPGAGRSLTAADHIRVTLDKSTEMEDEDEELDVGGEDEDDDLR
ncbi:hypothetical protein THASP1DRAFT_33154 [Thamnocephalis sphaerospora]|uniref:HTH APSES-type domain-containing protein n=1 Tax=Thamnocephalis sphaerospora TaxID=78915 RepID=A0A4P9XH93_9FUNG|nr:hypothetical protein THASP1DRAFT_33154 [Thamnocephalis sphaerospora]|eukprot:RKP05022.1 hypothetical protein THASP1DRAFT_33154 [Thamnocephalis sphaerospora]